MALRVRSSYDPRMIDEATTGASKERRRKDPAVRRAEILEAARNCVADYGFQGTSVDRIAAEAGVSVGLLYRFFKSKAAIVQAIIIEEVEAQLAQLSKAIDSHSLDAGGVSKLAMRALGGGTLDPKRVAMMFEISAEVCRNAELRAFLRDRHARSFATLREELVNKGADPAEAAETLQRIELTSAIVSAWGMRSVLYSDALSTSSVDQLLELIGEVFSLALDRKKAH